MQVLTVNDGAEREFRLAGRADPTNEGEIKRGIQRFRRLEGHGDATARQPNDRCLSQRSRQPLARVFSILEHRRASRCHAQSSRR